MQKLWFRNWFVPVAGTMMALLWANPLWAGKVYYASPSGSSSAAGTEEDPYDIKTAIGKLGDNTFDEARLLPGTYKVGSTKFSNVDYNARVIGMGASAREVVLDGEGAGNTMNVYYGGVLRNVTFTNYTSRVVSCLTDASSPHIVVSNCVFIGCSGNNNVMNISSVSPKEVRIFKTDFLNNSGAATYGGVICSGGGVARLEDCCFDGNSFSGYYEYGGAAICGISANGSFIIDTCTFTNNSSSTAYGGAVSCVGPCFVTNTTFACNKANSWGGGACYCKESDTKTNLFVDCRFFGNGIDVAGTYSAPGGAVRLSGSGLTQFRSCKFWDNMAVADGGAVYADNSEGVEFSDCTFNDNSTQSYGGACSICSAGKRIRYSGCTFTNNSSSAQCGGAIYASRKNDYIIEDSTFYSNSGTVGAGGAVAFAANVYTASVDRCRFIKNSSSFGGGVGIASAETKMQSCTVRNCLFDGNTSTYGGGISLVSNCSVDNCTFVKNACSGEGGAVYCSTGTGQTLRNCLFYGNRLTWGSAYAAWDIRGETVRLNNVSNSCSNIANVFPTANGNLQVADPCFANYAAGDYSLTSESPCRDKGLVLDWMVGAHDIRNERKIMRIMGEAPDIGCYEYRVMLGLMLIFR